MTKTDLLEKLKDLPDDTVIYVGCGEWGVTLPARKVFDVNDGHDGSEPEVTIGGE